MDVEPDLLSLAVNEDFDGVAVRYGHNLAADLLGAGERQYGETQEQEKGGTAKAAVHGRSSVVYFGGLSISC